MTAAAPNLQVTIPDTAGMALAREMVVPHDVVRLVKYLRSQNLTVNIGDGSRPLRYALKKGVTELFSDPVVVFAIGVPVGILTNLFANYLTDLFKGKASGKATETNIIIEVQEGDRRVRYSYLGEPLSDDRFDQLMKAAESAAALHRAARETKRPDPARPVPIFLEHTHQIIGWGRIKLEQGVMKIEDAKIDHDETCLRLDSGELSGLSIGGLASKATCSVCSGSYLDCLHVSGEEYDGRSCHVVVSDISLREISVVRHPVNQKAILRVRK